MKKIITCSIALILFLVFLSACSKKPDYSISDSSAIFPIQITELTSEDREKLSAEYTPNGYDEGITLSNSTAQNLYDILNFNDFKEITTEKSFFENLNDTNYISFWLFTDKNEMLTGSKGCFSIYENDIVCYSFSPIVSMCEYFKAPDGTYDSIKAIIDLSLPN